MNYFITYENIRAISFFISIVLGIIIMISYHKIVVRILVRKIENAINTGDKETAYKILAIAIKKQYKEKAFHVALDKFTARFSSEK